MTATPIASGIAISTIANAIVATTSARPAMKLSAQPAATASGIRAPAYASTLSCWRSSPLERRWRVRTASAAAKSAPSMPAEEIIISGT